MKNRTQIYLFSIFIIFTVVEEGVINKIAFSQTNTSSRNIINSKQEPAKGRFPCPNGNCRKRPPRNPANNINIINPSPIGYLLNNKPLLSWSKVPGVNTYTVRLEQAGKIIWELPHQESIESKIIKMQYPSNKPLLGEGNLYKLIVEASVNKEQKIGSIKFQTVPQKESQALKAEKQKIIQLRLNSEEKAIKLAYLYSGNKLFTDAIATLEDEIFTNKYPTVPILLMLGELYIKIEQPNLAEDYYQQALKKANIPNDIAAAKFGLGESNSGQDKLQLAIDWFLKAYDSYEKLGNREIITDIAKYLGELYEDSGNKNESIRWYQQARDGYTELNEIERQKYVEEKLRNLNR